MEDETKSLVETLIDNIAEANIDYHSKVAALCTKADRTTLAAAVVQLREQGTEGTVSHHNEEWAHLIEVAIGTSIAFERAAEVFAEGGTAYCLYHDGDMKNCPPGSHD